MNYYLNRYALFFLLIVLLSNSSMAQNQIHVSQFSKDNLREFPFKENFQMDYYFIFHSTEYIQSETGEIIKNADFDDSYNTDKTYQKTDSILALNDFDRYANFENNIPPALDSLPDGEYVQYYAPIPYQDGDTIKFIRNRIAIIYSLKNNVPNGSAYWFLASDQMQYKTGLYQNGKREGFWKFDFQQKHIYYQKSKKIFKRGKRNLPKIDYSYLLLSCNYVNNLKEGEQIKSQDQGTRIEITNYKNGLKEGLYKYEVKGQVITKGTFNNDIKCGEWFFYGYPYNLDEYLNENPELILMEHYIINDQRIKGKGGIIRDEIFYEDKFGHSRNFGSIEMTARFGFESISMNKIAHNFDQFFTSNNVLKTDEFGDPIGLNIKDSFDYILNYLEYERHYQNGQLFLKFSSENGNLIQQNDTVFRENGLPANILFKNKSTNEIEEHYYSKEGKLEHKVYFDSIGNEITHRTIEGLRYSNLYGDWYYENNNKISKNSKDTLFLRSQKRDEQDYHIIEQTTYCPRDFQGFVKKELLDSSIRLQGTFQLDSVLLTSHYIQTISIGPIQIKAELDDSLLNNQYYEYYAPNALDTFYWSEVIDFGDLTDISGKYEILKNGLSFTGKLIFHLETDTFFITEKSNELHIHMNAADIGLLKNLFPNLKNCLPKIIKYDPYSWSSTTEIKLYDQKKYNFYNAKTVIFPVKQGKIEGNVEIKNFNNKILGIIPCVQNSINGAVKFHSNYPEYFSYRKPKKAEKYFTSDIIPFKIGEINGYKVVLTENGDTLEKVHYPILPLEGKIKTGYSNIIEYTTYKNGLRNGEYEFLDTKNDVCFIGNYENDSLDGPVFEYNSGKLISKGIFDHGMLMDTVFEYDLNGTINSYLIYEQNHFVKQATFHNGILKSELNNTSLKNKLGIPWNPRATSISKKYIQHLNYFDKIDTVYIFYSEYKFYKKNGYFNEFSIDGNLVKEGNYIDDLKTGKWKYNYPETKGIYTINYFDSTLKINDSLNFKTIGYFEQKDNTGNILSKRFLLSDTAIYNCNQGETFEIETFYILFEKDSALGIRNGYFKNYYSNGVLQSEGENLNGLPQGLWKFYNDNGSLRETGHFKNGKKTGRWLSGDLSKIHYTGDLCFDLDNESIVKYIESIEKILKIKECFYQDGQLISENEFTIHK